MTLCDIRPLKGVEPSKNQVLIAIKIKILANFDFDRKNSIQSFGLGFSVFHEM